METLETSICHIELNTPNCSVSFRFREERRTNTRPECPSANIDPKPNTAYRNLLPRPGTSP